MGVNEICKLGIYCLQNLKKRLGLVLAFLVRNFPSLLPFYAVHSGHPVLAAVQVPCMLGPPVRQCAAPGACGLTLRNNSLGLQPWTSYSSSSAWGLADVISHQENTKNKGIPNFLKNVPSGGRLEPNSGSLRTARQTVHRCTCSSNSCRRTCQGQRRCHWAPD